MFKKVEYLVFKIQYLCSCGITDARKYFSLTQTAIDLRLVCKIKPFELVRKIFLRKKFCKIEYCCAEVIQLCIMLLDSYLDLTESLKNGVTFAFTCFVLLPLLMAIAPVNGAQNFPVYRVNQLDTLYFVP